MISGSKDGGRGLQRLAKTFAFLFAGPRRRYRVVAAAEVVRTMIQLARAGSRGRFTYESDVIGKMGKK